LISLALVSENKESFYAEFTDYAASQVNDWIKENVISNLFLSQEIEHYKENWRVRGNSLEIREALRMFLKQFDQIHIWGDCLAYDWVLNASSLE